MRGTLLPIVTLLLLMSLALPGPGSALDRAAYQELMFKAEHDQDPAVREAVKLLVERGVMERGVSYQDTRRGATPADCQVLIGEGLLQSAILRDLLNKQLPKQVLEMKLRFADAAILISGRLDGPLFLNPRFEATLDFAFVTANSFRIRVHSLRVAGFELSLFTGILKGYVENAMKRVFIKGCQTRTTEGKDSVDIDVTINPDGFVPGLGKKAYLSGMEMSARQLRFSFSLTR